MDESLVRIYEDVLTFVESDVQCWKEAARHCESHSVKLSEREAAEWQLLGAVYRERADIQFHLAANLRKQTRSLALRVGG